MVQLDVRTRAHVRELVESMRSFDAGAPSALSWITPELPRVLGTEKVSVFTFRSHGDRVAVGSFAHVGLPADSRRYFEGWLSRQAPVGWTTYNPVRPEPRQRNRVFDLRSLERVSGLSPLMLPVVDLLTTLGVAHDEQLRVLVCEGASLLAYVGAYQSEPFSPRQKAALAALVPALGRRLTFERMVTNSARKAAALDAALEAIGRPAFVVSTGGAIHELNASARTLLARANLDVRRELVDAIARRPNRYAFDLTLLRNAGSEAYLAVLRDAGSTRREEQVSAATAAARWGLTPRQGEVLEMVVRGMANATIAAEMGVSERAIEKHVTAIFDRAGVENRATLVARVMRPG